MRLSLIIGLLSIGCAACSAPRTSTSRGGPTGTATAAATPTAATAAPAPPHIVIVLTDDQGYGDVGAYGGTHVRTPELDRLAAEGTLHRGFRVAQAVCSASRAALLTGRYAQCVGIRGALEPGHPGLEPAVATLPEVLAKAGYRSHLIGKWHLGDRHPYLPTDQGFASYFGIPYSHDMTADHPLPQLKGRWPAKVPLMRDDRVVDSLSAFTTVTRQYNAEAVARIRAHDPAAGPLLLMVHHSLPHVPLAEDPTYGSATGLGVYADVVAEVDTGIGELRAALRERGMDANTLILFTSDNGPWLSYGGHAGRTGGLREGKQTSFEGGVRVPLIVHGPGVAPGREMSSALMTIDVLPSLAGLAGVTALPEQLDGRERWATFSGQSESVAERPYLVYWVDRLEAVVSRTGRWKLHLPHAYRTLDGPQRDDGLPGPTRVDSIGLSLFDLHADAAERVNVAERYPDTLRTMMAAAAGAGCGTARR